MFNFSKVSQEQRELIVLRTAMQLMVAVLSPQQKDLLHKLAEGSKQTAIDNTGETVGEFSAAMFDEVIELFRSADVR